MVRSRGIALIAAFFIAAPFASAESKPSPLAGNEAQVFAQALLELSNTVAEVYAKPVTSKELLAAGMAAVYAEAGEKFPDALRKEILNSDGWSGTLRLIAEARTNLGQRDALRGVRAFVIAANGFSAATDPYSGLMWARTGSIAEAEAGFGLGFELEGVSGTRWLAYQIESAGTYPLPRESVPEPPVGANWTVRRVVPGSPAARAGMRPGDRLTHLNGDEITATTNAKLFQLLTQLSNNNGGIPADGTSAVRPVQLRIRRQGSETPIEAKLVRTSYMPESIFGVIRRENGSWDYMLDKDAKVGYIRVAAVEDQADEEFEKALEELTQNGVRGLILDLRWCPGGYVDPTSRIAGALLSAGKVIATIEVRNPQRGGRQTYTSEPLTGNHNYNTLPLLVLVNGETTGGGELIAAALQDHSRATIVGQRTFGKANIMNLANTSFHPLQFRVSTGYSFRPSGKPRHRFPDSKPTDDWGVRPDKGYEIPVTPDLSAKLRQHAERQAIRPSTDTEIVPFDDPLLDAQKMVALKFLKEKLAEKK